MVEMSQSVEPREVQRVVRLNAASVVCRKWSTKGSAKKWERGDGESSSDEGSWTAAANWRQRKDGDARLEDGYSRGTVLGCLGGKWFLW